MLPKQYEEILRSYISDRLYRIKQEDEYSGLKEINPRFGDDIAMVALNISDLQRRPTSSIKMNQLIKNKIYGNYGKRTSVGKLNLGYVI